MTGGGLVARPPADTDLSLPHVAIAGDTYTIVVSEHASRRERAKALAPLYRTELLAPERA